MKTTGWIDGWRKPVRVGVYQRLNPSGDAVWSYWNGEFWGYLALSKKAARDYSRFPSAFQERPWRGLTEKAQ